MSQKQSPHPLSLSLSKAPRYGLRGRGSFDDAGYSPPLRACPELVSGISGGG